MRFPRIVCSGLLLITVAFSLFVYPALPSRIPIHFAFDGTPDGWAQKSLIVWLLLPMVGVGLWGLIELIGMGITRSPTFVNLPNKEKFLALPKEKQYRIVERLREVLGWIVAGVLLLFGLIQYSMYLSAVIPPLGEKVNEAIGIGVLVVVPVFAVGLIIVLSRMVDRVSEAP